MDWSAIQEEVLAEGQRVWQCVHCFTQSSAAASPNTESCYAAHSALTVGWALTVAIIVYSFVWSLLGRNCSKVDQIWSITPVVFVGHALYHYFVVNHMLHYRLLLVFVLVLCWGVRLTFNFYRKGGYGNFFQHEEDYRWPILREAMHPFVFWIVFNLTFIASYQNILLFLIAAPAFEIAKTDPHTLLTQDYVLGLMFIAFFLIETIADEQHFEFQTLKHSLTAVQRNEHPNPDIRNGFFTKGLFRFSRHPNYMAEQTMWVLVYLFSVNFLTFGGGSFGWEQVVSANNWTFTGCLQLILLFQGSMTFSESICCSKYPQYRKYQQRVSRCIMGFPGSLEASEKKKQ